MTTIKLTDVTLSVGTLVLVLLAVAAVAAAGSTEEFTAWAWERHHNVLSWYIRSLFLCNTVTPLQGEHHRHPAHPFWSGDEHVVVPRA